MRKDASTIEQWQLTPTSIDTMGYNGGAFQDIARACDRWLAKRGVMERHHFSKWGLNKAQRALKAKRDEEEARKA